MKIIFKIILGIIVVFSFPATGTGVYIFLIRPPLVANNILKNGIETTATIIGIDSRLAKTSNGKKENYYNLTLIFQKMTGEEIQIKTNSIYSEQFIKKQNIGSYNSITRKYDTITNVKVQIMYLGNNAVVKEYVPDKTDRILWLFPVIFNLIGVLIFISLIVGIKNDKMDAKIKQFGTCGTGKYLKHTRDRVNGVILYKIYYSFKNDIGDTIETIASFANRCSEAEAIIQMQSFPVKYIGKKAIILLKNE